MIKSILFVHLVFFVCYNVNAQQRFEIGVEGGPSKYYYEIQETQNNLEKVPANNGFGGVNFRYNSRKEFFLEMGFLLTEYTVGLKLKQHSGYLTGNHDEVLFIPLRFGYPLPITKNISFVPSIGFTTAIKTLNQDGGFTSYEEGNSNGNNRYEYKFREIGKDLFFLVNGNASIEWKFARRLKAATGLSYYQGVSKISVADIRYKLTNESEQTGLLIGKGTFLGYTFGLKYLLK